MSPSDALAPIIDSSMRAFERALRRVGWEVRSVEINAAAGTARVEVVRGDLLATLDVSHGRATITRERIRHRVAAVGRRGDRALVDRVGTEFIGRARYAEPVEALRALAAYVEDNGVAPRLSSAQTIALIGRRRVRSSEAIDLATRALEAGLVLRAFDSYAEQECTVGPDRRADGSTRFACHSYGRGNGTEAPGSLEFDTARELARYLVGNRIVPGMLGTYPTWGAAVVALRKAGLAVECDPCE